MTDNHDPIDQHHKELEDQQHLEQQPPAADPEPEAAQTQPRTVRVRCGQKTEVYSRVVGYFRPVQQWNNGKRAEFNDRVEFKINGGQYEQEAKPEHRDQKAGLHDTTRDSDPRRLHGVEDTRADQEAQGAAGSNVPDQGDHADR